MSQQFAFFSSECSLEHLQTPELTRDYQPPSQETRFALSPNELAERFAHPTMNEKASAKSLPQKQGYFTELTESSQVEAPVDGRLFTRSQTPERNGAR